MADQNKGQDSEHQNEGEGSRTAARRYNKDQQEFIKSGKVDKAAQEAKEAIESDEADELEEAEEEGLSHRRGEDSGSKGGH
jgi:hypothetical protein